MPTMKDLRYIRCLTQRELANQVGVSENLVWMWERGQRSPGPKSREKLYEIFGTNDIQFSEQKADEDE
jgi:transcriptional regulator with XRE-family HTH domain